MKKIFAYVTVGALIPLSIIIGILIGGKAYSAVALIIAVLSCVPFFVSFESKQADTKRLVIIAVLIALSVAGRMIFAPIPAFKPITATVILAGAYFGGEAGFMVGSLTAVISNFYFGQGAWTPFQMFIWGIIGFVAGLIFKRRRSSVILLTLYAFIAGIIYSLFMDLWSVAWIDGGFNFARYGALVVASLPTMAVYAVSNIVFILLLYKPVGRIFERLKIKYGI